MKSILYFAIILSFLPNLGCVSAKFKKWSGSEIYQFKGGGAVEQINGIDVWEMGMPNRPFKIIGMIDSGTPISFGAGLSLINLLLQDPLIIESAIEHCADGIILVDEKNQFLGQTRRGTSIISLKKVVIAIKYMDDAVKINDANEKKRPTECMPKSGNVREDEGSDF